MLYKLLFSAIIGSFVAIRVHHRKHWTGIERTSVASRRERILTSGIVISQLLSAVLWLGGHLAVADLLLPDAIRLSGLLVGIIGLVLLERVHAALGANFSPRLEIRPDHTLIQHGPYARIRHPMYTSGALLILSYGLLTANLIVLLLPAVMLALLVALRIPDEEAMLEATFGDEYRQWRTKSGYFLPKLS
ncbi:MAG: isoprenylcysteine carboxylmethyltransferase family protein [Myxococcota bacterium]|nr:isoprenylcysteine carboxylmethyltransferase family protein [Myxococcota bacterium]